MRSVCLTHTWAPCACVHDGDTGTGGSALYWAATRQYPVMMSHAHSHATHAHVAAPTHIPPRPRDAPATGQVDHGSIISILSSPNC
jgi:hypothetical protein